MCLVIKRVKPRIAKFDIPVYKVLSYGVYGWEYSIIELGTPVTHTPVDLSKPLVAKISNNKDLIKKAITFKNDELLSIDEGVIHCYWLKNKADLFYGYTIFKAYIPKGTEYWIGRGDSWGEIGAKQIVFKEQK